MSVDIALTDQVMLQEHITSPDEYLAMARRRLKPAVFVFSTIFLLAAIVAMVWPASYLSQAVILVEEQEIPQDMVRSTVSSYVDQQIQVIEQRVMTLETIMGIIKQYEVYPEIDIARLSRTEIADRFRRAVSIEVISSELSGGNSGRAQNATTAFTLGFESTSPQKAQQVANQLIDLFLNENLRARTERTASTEEFLRQEVEVLKKTLSDTEQELAEFKVRYKDSLPENFQINVHRLTQLQAQLTSSFNILEDLNKREIELSSQLSQINPYAPTVLPSGQAVLSDTDRLKALEAEYRNKAALYNANHPDIKRLQREIDMLAAKVGDSDLESVPDNPAYIVLQNEISGVRVDRSGVRRNIEQLESEMEIVNESLILAPTIEKEFAQLQRTLQTTQIKYLDLSAKLHDAELSGALEQERKGQRFIVVEPPIIPDEPVSPNRLALLSVGIILAGAAAAGLVLVLESLDQSILSEKSLTAVTGHPPLIAIKYIFTPGEDAARKPGKKFLIIGGAGLMSILLVLILIHNAYQPLDVLWFRIARKLGIGWDGGI